MDKFMVWMEGDKISVACTLCMWKRKFATFQGAEQRLTEHMLRKHKIRIFWDRKAKEEQ